MAMWENHLSYDVLCRKNVRTIHCYRGVYVRYSTVIYEYRVLVPVH